MFDQCLDRLQQTEEDEVFVYLIESIIYLTCKAEKSIFDCSFQTFIGFLAEMKTLRELEAHLLKDAEKRCIWQEGMYSELESSILQVGLRFKLNYVTVCEAVEAITHCFAQQEPRLSDEAFQRLLCEAKIRSFICTQGKSNHLIVHKGLLWREW